MNSGKLKRLFIRGPARRVSRAAAAISLLPVFLAAASATGEPPTSRPPFIHNSAIQVNPKNPSIVYASFWIYGVYKSLDYGKTWKLSGKGFKNISVYNLLIHPQKPDIIYAGTHAGGIYKTTDAGENWFEISEGLASGTVWDLAGEPADGEVVYALTSDALYKTEDGGRHWQPLPGGIPGPPADQQMTLMMVPFKKPALFLQNHGLLYRRTEAGWTGPVLKGMTTIRCKPLAYDARSNTLYAGTVKGLVKSADGGASWTPLYDGIKLAAWMALDPNKPGILYVGDDGSGMYKSVDRGRSFQAVNNGLTGTTSHKIFGLAIDPKDGRRLYAASHSIGLFRTEDGAASWTPPERFPVPPVSELMAQTRAAVMAAAEGLPELPSPPAEFTAHCNKCHGWVDPRLDAREDVTWRALPTRRNWTATVRRMGWMAGLDDSQKETITRYLNEHFGLKNE